MSSFDNNDLCEGKSNRAYCWQKTARLQPEGGDRNRAAGRRLRPCDLGAVSYPWLADTQRALASALGILDEGEGVALRATFIVDPGNIIRFVSINDLNVGRNPKEVLRVLDALQTDELCPCNWQAGDEVLKPAA